MKIVFVAHPISGDIEANLADIRRIVRRINLQYPDVVPFVPYYVDVVSLYDTIPEERARGIKNDMEILTRKIPDELWLTGDRISYGMSCEKNAAEIIGIPVINKLNLF